MSKQTKTGTFERCRLVLCMGQEALVHCRASQLSDILAAGDVASVILSPGRLDESEYQKYVEPLVRAAQEQGVAAIIDGYSRIAGRVLADGLQLGQDATALKLAIDKFSPGMMVGACGVKTRHQALTIGELQPDYILFGKPGADIRTEPHPKNLALGEWWSAIVEIPCIVLGGTALESALEVANCGVEFVALGSAIFTPDQNANTNYVAADRVRLVNQLLDQHAPRFDTINN